jgi:hypothetical protein
MKNQSRKTLWILDKSLGNSGTLIKISPYIIGRIRHESKLISVGNYFFGVHVIRKRSFYGN